ncbi:MOXD2 protein, partial [Sakesphorus luctuosus]|nr:MOXD2 protein [Sakesphorus luctuosus]
MAMSFSRIHGMLFILSCPCRCSAQLAAPLLPFSNFLGPSHMVSLCWDHDEEELMTIELQVCTTGWVAIGFSPRGELPGSDTVIGGVFPNGSIYISVS